MEAEPINGIPRPAAMASAPQTANTVQRRLASIVNPGPARRAVHDLSFDMKNFPQPSGIQHVSRRAVCHDLTSAEEHDSARLRSSRIEIVSDGDYQYPGIA